MPRKKNSDDAQIQLVSEVKTLSKEVRKLKDLEFIKVFNHPVKLLVKPLSPVFVVIFILLCIMASIFSLK